MTYAAILTHVQADAHAAPRLVCAHDLAVRFNARLIGVGIEMIQPLAFDEGLYAASAEWAIAMRSSVEARLAGAERLFRQHTVDLARDKQAWMSGMQMPCPALTNASRAADLIVAGGAPRTDNDPYRTASPAELAMQAGRPVLVAPAVGGPLSAQNVIIAWKDTREARRALSDALPFLQQARAVEVIEICDADSRDDALIRIDDVADALRRRGIAATAKILEGGAPARLIQAEALAFGADLVVMGCYGHTRLGEWVFGGVTRDLLAQDQVHLLLSH